MDGPSIAVKYLCNFNLSEDSQDFLFYNNDNTLTSSSKLASVQQNKRLTVLPFRSYGQEMFHKIFDIRNIFI